MWNVLYGFRCIRTRIAMFKLNVQNTEKFKWHKCALTSLLFIKKQIYFLLELKSRAILFTFISEVEEREWLIDCRYHIIIYTYMNVDEQTIVRLKRWLNNIYVN